MKTILTILFIGFFFNNSVGQIELKEKDVPKVIIDSFQTHFPAAKVDRWEKDWAIYRVAFTWGDLTMYAEFEGNGKFLRKAEEMTRDDIPYGIKEYIIRYYPGFTIAKVMMVQRPSGEFNWEINIHQGINNIRLVFNDLGEYLRHEEIKPYDKKDIRNFNSKQRY